jgi:hypothetical protein
VPKTRNRLSPIDFKVSFLGETVCNPFDPQSKSAVEKPVSASAQCQRFSAKSVNARRQSVMKRKSIS